MECGFVAKGKPAHLRTKNGPNTVQVWQHSESGTHSANCPEHPQYPSLELAFKKIATLEQEIVFLRFLFNNHLFHQEELVGRDPVGTVDPLVH